MSDTNFVSGELIPLAWIQDVNNTIYRALGGTVTPGAAAAFIGALSNPMTTAGDIITGGAAGAVQRLGVGTAGQVLTVVGGVPAWAAAGGYTPPPLPVNAQTGTAYILALTDAPVANASQGIVTMNNAAANTVTVPPNSSVAFPVGAQVQVVQFGAGQTAIVADAGVTVSTPSSLTARAQYSTLVLTQVAANSWVLGGDMT